MKTIASALACLVTFLFALTIANLIVPGFNPTSGEATALVVATACAGAAYGIVYEFWSTYL